VKNCIAGHFLTLFYPEIHGGKIWVESEPKKGPPFILPFPNAASEFDNTAVIPWYD
jgi:hypothetical protein